MPETATTFGAWLRHQRRQLDLTQTELAARIGYSVVTIRKLERDELRPSKQLAERLVQHLNVAVTHRPGVIAFARTPSTYPPLADALPGQNHVVGNLAPQLTPFIGRVAELLELAQSLTDPACRLLTVVGPGGIGKTRLALEVAQTLGQQTPDGVYFVALAPLRASEHVVPAIAEALDFRFQTDSRLPKQQLLDYLRHKQLLLLLDNFEHLHDGVDLLQELLHGCPGLRLLVTSRERLQLSSETVFVLDSLDVPPGTLPQAALSYSAVQLFVETARRTHPKFTLDATNEQAVVYICRLVGGIPLAIILAAAWVKLLSPAEIVTELGQGFDFLETELRDLPDRQRSVRAVLTYSWQQLTPAEQAVFMRLALFQGGFTRVAAQAVAGASLPILARLVDKSFVQPMAGGRFDIHGLVRQYAERQLQAAGALGTAQEAHGVYYLSFLQRCEAGMAGADQLAIIFQLEADFENIRAAWQWAVRTHNYGLVDCALDGIFRWFWLRRSRQQEGLALLHLAHQQWAPSAGQMPTPVWGRILARMMEQQGPWLVAPTAVRERLEQALALAQQQANQTEIAFCTSALGLAIVSEHRDSLHDKDLQPAMQLFEQSIVAYRTGADQFRLAQTLEHLGHCYRRLHYFERALALLHESLDLRRTVGDRFGMARCFRELGFVTLAQGLERETEEWWQAAYTLQCELGDQQGMTDSRLFLAVLALSRGDWQLARAIADQVMQLAIEMNNPFYQQHALRVLEIATCMADSTQHDNALACSFPNRLCPFTASLLHMFFSTTRMARCNHLLRSLAAAATDLETAVCLPFAADLVAQAGDLPRAVMLLALAFRYPHIAEGWIGHLPEIVALQQELKHGLPPADFASGWAQGQALDLRTTAAAAVAELATAEGID